MARLNGKNKIKMKSGISNKSQITMFMIIGLLLFIIIGLALYLSKSTIKKQSKESIKKIQEIPIDVQPIKEFVTRCLDKLAKDAIILIGRQGGYIYKSQGGTLADYMKTDEGTLFLKYDGNDITYNILPPKFAAQSYSSQIPDYPWIIFPYEDASSNMKFNGFFGINNMPPLTYLKGSNSMQTQIESFVDNNIESCADFSVFEKQGYSIVMNPAKTSVVISNNDVSVKSKIPITVTNSATNELTQLEDFSAILNVRLKNTHLFTKELINNDIKNIKFDIGGSGYGRDFLSANLVENVLHNDDLVVVTDEKSLINGNPFEYVFARRNRAPALHYIRPNIISFPRGYLINETDLLQNNTLNVDDPDEDNYTLNIFIGEFGTQPAQFPKKLDAPQIKFRIEVSDGQLSDYQVITVNRI